MAKLEFFIFLLIKCVNCAFFDLTDVDDPLSLFWKPPKEHFSNPYTSASCITPISGGSVLTGFCKHKTLCLLSGGQIHSQGNCGPFLTCCTKSPTCTHRTKAKISFFSSEISRFAPDCEYIVEVQDNVCQVRLDFEHFQLSPSTRISVSSSATTELYSTVCENDYMTITPPIQNISRFCGNNNGQHAYIHLNSEKEVKLHIHLAGISSTNSIPSWRIRVTQLECPTRGNIFTKFHIFGTGVDLPLLAPPGVTQYFTEPAGRIKSFGFNGDQNEYISGLHYAIGFKKTPSVNCIRFTTNKLSLRHNKNPNNFPKHCIDYLFVPEFRNITTMTDYFGSEVCVEQTDTVIPEIFYSAAPGPFYIYFLSQSAFTENSTVIHAFDLQYELRNCY